MRGLISTLRRLPRWGLATAGGGALVALTASVLLVVQSVSASCASAAPALGVPALAGSSGKATYYTIGGNGGNCSFGAQSSPLYVALGPSEYRAAGGCGGYFDVTGPKGTVRVKAVDQCPECAPGHLDLSLEAFKEIGNQVDGIIPITYQAVRDPAVPGPITIRVKEGSSRFWLALLADNHGNPLAKVELGTGSGGWRSLTRASFNYWLDESGAGPGPFTVRLTDTTGRQATVTGISLTPGTTQRTGVSMYSGAVSPPGGGKTRPSAPAKAPPAPGGAAPVAAPPGPAGASGDAAATPTDGSTTLGGGQSATPESAAGTAGAASSDADVAGTAAAARPASASRRCSRG